MVGKELNEVHKKFDLNFEQARLAIEAVPREDCAISSKTLEEVRESCKGMQNVLAEHMAEHVAFFEEVNGVAVQSIKIDFKSSSDCTVSVDLGFLYFSGGD